MKHAAIKCFFLLLDPSYLKCILVSLVVVVVLWTFPSLFSIASWNRRPCEQDLDDLDHIELPQSLEDEEGGFGGDLADLDQDLDQYKD